jgi:diaminopimelate decarboxylase
MTLFGTQLFGTQLFGTQTINSQGRLEVGGCDTVELAERFGTPLYVVDEEALRRRCQDYRAAFSAESPDAKVAYATKAFLSKAVARLVHEEGLDLDVASLGELLTVAAAGVPMAKVTLHGNYKKDDEIDRALDLQVGLVALDSLDECRQLAALAARRGMRQRAVLRVAPGIDGHTLDAISTGRNDTKFGVTVENGAAAAAVEECLRLGGVELVGLHAHIGSQILGLDPFALLGRKMVELTAALRHRCGWSPQLLVLGGGLGIRYTDADQPPSVANLARALFGAVREEAARRGLQLPRLGVEPGRSITGECGLTLYRVGPVKTVPIGDDPRSGPTRTYASVDGGLSDNPRPLMYGARYPVLLANRALEAPAMEVCVSGRHCETDTLCESVRLPPPRPGDVIAVLATGAYNHAMASNYNAFYRPPVVFVRSGDARLVVRRETQEDLLARDVG